jgi:hypothetical protein
MRLWGTGALLVAVVAASCSDETVFGDSGSGAGPASGATATSVSKGAGASGGMGGLGGIQQGPGGGSAEGGTGEGGNPVDECPPDPGDDICMECLKDECCDRITACMADDRNCGPCLACILEEHDINACNFDCDVSDDTTGDMVVCMYNSCQEPCVPRE